MAQDAKSKKISDFYLTELLNHVKTMADNRVSPLEFSVTKKILHFITQSDNLVVQISKLLPVASLKNVTEILTKNISRLENSGYKMSSMIASLEGDSERILQAIIKSLSGEGAIETMGRELEPIGLELDVEYLRKNYEKKKDESEAPTSFQIKLPSSDKQTPSAVKTSPIIEKAIPETKERTEEKVITEKPAPKKRKKSVKKVKTEEAPVVKASSDEFGNVSEMIGFLTSRNKKVKTEPVKEEKIKKEKKKNRVNR